MSAVGLIQNGLSYPIGYDGQPVARAYSKIRLYGDATFDDLHLRDYTYTDEEVLSLSSSSSEVWDNHTLLLSQFQNSNLAGGNITNLSSQILFWDIYRREIGSSLAVKLATIDVSVNEYIDITAQTGKVYEYILYGVSDTETSEPLVSEQIKSDYYNHILIDPSTSKSYIFDLNAQTETIENPTDVAKYDSVNSKYPAFSYGNRNYLQSGISAIVGDISSSDELLQGVDLLYEIQDVINNKKVKLLKTRKGELIWVHTQDMSRNILDDGISQQPYLISFKWTQTKAPSEV